MSGYDFIYDPDKIYEHFTSRIERTNLLFKKFDEMEPEEQNNVYFKYYFDIFTTIEAILRGIVFKLSDHDDYLRKIGKAIEKSRSFFLTTDDIKILFSEVFFTTFFESFSYDDLKRNFISTIDLIKEEDFSIEFNRETFLSGYKHMQKTRNTLAHSLVLTDIEFSRDTLKRYSAILYIIMERYKNL